MTDQPLDSRSAWQFGLATVVVTAAMSYFAGGLHPVWWLGWIAPLPALVLAPRIGKLAAFLVSFAGWVLGGFSWWNYLHVVIRLPLSVFVLAVVSAAVVFGLGVLLSRAFLLRGSLWRAALALPSVWVTFEYLNAVTSPHSTFSNLAYTQMDFLPLLQVASVAGVWGIDFLLFFFPATIAAILVSQSSASHKRRFAGIVGILYIAVLSVGTLRLLSPPNPAEKVTVGLIASDVRENAGTRPGEAGMAILARYLDQVPSLAAQGAKTIIIPEKVADVADAEIPRMDQMFQSAAVQNHVDILVGIDHHVANGYLNEARFYRADGQPVTTYVKHHLIPAFERRDRPGTSYSVFSDGATLHGIAICKDMDFPALSRHYGKAGIALLLVPAWDFGTDGWYHDRMAVMRGVENGFTVARSAKEGLLTISDPRARVIAQQHSDAAPFASLVATIPITHVTTFYSIAGDWFAWINIAALTCMLFVAFRRKQEFARASSAS
ncbi:MAG TPA: nitrilase-related carbon-nitrogen hydrolase [Terriglobales bacterium]|nr:nitrilase-related carbon-nitrogen hydrolase [Terriglobales bacterium]